MFTLLMVLHFVALSMAMGGGLANIIAKRQMAKVDPVTYPGMAAATAAVVKLSTAGLALLWITGVWMTTLKYGISGMPYLLWVKIAIVGALTCGSISLNVMLISARRAGTRPDSSKIDKHAYFINSLALITVAVAVVLFR